ncbi:hypothetical protein PPACK8108_LOCUS10676 [Phakopsora pachyrhizi]|uniref:Uncharacterized protein n=1 Tax=Phakopsora pachyrhizi TaxID=170000 RepID=A0AAV0B1S4_PHAPC|nr:hypothetical protein PPACK8108_LOCUS10676 [Phakopsora pachyrhizi]
MNQETLQCLKKLHSNSGFVNAHSFEGEENNGFSSNHYQINQNHLGPMANVSILLAQSTLPLILIFRMKHMVEHIPFISVNCLGIVMSSGLSSPVAATDRIDQIPARLNSHRPSIPDSQSKVENLSQSQFRLSVLIDYLNRLLTLILSVSVDHINSSQIFSLSDSLNRLNQFGCNSNYHATYQLRNLMLGNLQIRTGCNPCHSSTPPLV